MPIFDYVCEKCNSKTEKLVKRAELDVQTCDVCNEHLSRVDEISNTSFALKGVWFKSHKRY
jgi:putative FmdB family regulatory protein